MCAETKLCRPNNLGKKEGVEVAMSPKLRRGGGEQRSISKKDYELRGVETQWGKLKVEGKKGTGSQRIDGGEKVLGRVKKFTFPLGYGS